VDNFPPGDRSRDTTHAQWMLKIGMCVWCARVIKKIRRKTATADEETLTGEFNACGLALYDESG